MSGFQWCWVMFLSFFSGALITAFFIGAELPYWLMETLLVLLTAGVAGRLIVDWRAWRRR